MGYNVLIVISVRAGKLMEGYKLSAASPENSGKIKELKYIWDHIGAVKHKFYKITVYFCIFTSNFATVIDFMFYILL